MYIECRHIFPSGKKCESPALRQQDFCYFHHNKRNQKAPSRKSGEPSTLTHHLPQLEDPDTILTALSDVILALGANRIDPRRAQILIYGLQVASQHSRHISRDVSLETVRDIYEDEDGALVGPRCQRYDTADIVIDEEDDEEDEEDKHLREIEERWEREIEEQYGPKEPSSQAPLSQEPSMQDKSPETGAPTPADTSCSPKTSREPSPDTPRKEETLPPLKSCHPDRSPRGHSGGLPWAKPKGTCGWHLLQAQFSQAKSKSRQERTDLPPQHRSPAPATRRPHPHNPPPRLRPKTNHQILWKVRGRRRTFRRRMKTVP